MADEAGEKTEQATDKRMKEVRQKGQLSRSQDLTAWLAVGAAAAMMPGTIRRGSAAATDQMFNIGTIASTPDAQTALVMLGEGMGSFLLTLAPMLAAVVVVVIAGAAAQGGIRFKKFKGKFEQFNPVSGLKQTFGTQALWNGAKALLKTAVVGVVLWSVVQGLTPILMTAGGLPVSELLGAARGGVVALIQYAVAAGVILAFADVFVVAKRNRKKTRMTKKEIKDENKSSEGDPMIKSQRRARQMAMSRNRMISAVADSDVVLVNPTHIAIAVKYEAGKSAPRVVAKGSGVIALKIREKAEEGAVPIVKDVPLARALHSGCEVGQEIPAEFYSAVAGVLAFVMSLRQRGGYKGVQTPPASSGSYLAS